MKKSKIITQQLKPIENPNIIDVKSVTIEYLKTLHKLFKTMKGRLISFPKSLVLAKIILVTYILRLQNMKNVWTKKMQK